MAHIYLWMCHSAQVSSTFSTLVYFSYHYFIWQLDTKLIFSKFYWVRDQYHLTSSFRYELWYITTFVLDLRIGPTDINLQNTVRGVHPIEIIQHFGCFNLYWTVQKYNVVRLEQRFGLCDFLMFFISKLNREFFSSHAATLGVLPGSAHFVVLMGLSVFMLHYGLSPYLKNVVKVEVSTQFDFIIAKLVGETRIFTFYQSCSIYHMCTSSHFTQVKEFTLSSLGNGIVGGEVRGWIDVIFFPCFLSERTICISLVSNAH